MKDLLGRELKDGDMCIGMAIGRNSSGMHLGVFQGSSVVYLSYNEEYINKSCTSNTYLIANPTDQELEIKNKIQEFLEEEAKERERKANLKTIPLSKLEVGGIYKTTQDQAYIYLGKRKVILEDLERNLHDTQEGHCFAFIYSFEDKTDEDIINKALNINTHRRKHNIDVLKGNKKLTELVRKVNLEFPLIKEEEIERDWRCRKRFRLTVE